MPRNSFISLLLVLPAVSLGGYAQAAKTTPPTPAAEAPPPLAAKGAATTTPAKWTVVEQVVARVNDKIITTSDVEQARQEMMSNDQDEAQQDHWSSADLAKREQQDSNDLLRNLIDEQLLLQKAQSLGYSADTDTVLRLDQIRQQYHLASMEDLQKMVEQQGDNYEEFKQNLNDQMLEQKVITEDIGPRVTISPGEIEKYYNDHKADFVTKEEVQLSEILIATTGKTGEELTHLKDLANQIQQRAAKGEDFASLAKRYSNADDASNGGAIGSAFEKATLGDLAKDIFALQTGGVTPVENAPNGNGFLILKVTGLHHGGQETLDEAHNQIENVLYQQKMRPELREYLTKLRQESYIPIKTGYVDTGSTGSSSVDLEKFERVLPSDLPKPDDSSSKKTTIGNGGGGGGLN